MVNVLIADDNVDYAIILMNYINEQNGNIRVCNITKDGKETLNVLNSKNNIDIILLDYQMPFYNGMQILRKLQNKNKYIDSCLVISGELNPEAIKLLRDNELVHSILFKTLSMKDIKNKILQLVKYKEITIKNVENYVNFIDLNTKKCYNYHRNKDKKQIQT